MLLLIFVIVLPLLGLVLMNNGPGWFYDTIGRYYEYDYIDQWGNYCNRKGGVRDVYGPLNLPSIVPPRRILPGQMAPPPRPGPPAHLPRPKELPVKPLGPTKLW